VDWDLTCPNGTRTAIQEGVHPEGHFSNTAAFLSPAALLWL